MIAIAKNGKTTYTIAMKKLLAIAPIILASCINNDSNSLESGVPSDAIRIGGNGNETVCMASNGKYIDFVATIPDTVSNGTCRFEISAQSRDLSGIGDAMEDGFCKFTIEEQNIHELCKASASTFFVIDGLHKINTDSMCEILYM